MVMPRATLDEHGFSDTLRTRLERKLHRTPNGCLEWTGATYGPGYGHLSRGPRGAGLIPAHVATWILTNGPIPDGMVIRHTCDNPPCCDLAHLLIGTQQDNIADMIRRGRARGQIPAGERHPDARLTDQQVAELRDAYSTISNYAEIGRRYGITKQHARALVLRLRRA